MCKGTRVKQIWTSGKRSNLPVFFLSFSGYFETMDPTEGLQTFLPFSTAELIQFHPTQTSYSVCIGHGTANKNVVASTPSTVYIALVLKFTEVTCLLD